MSGCQAFAGWYAAEAPPGTLCGERPHATVTVACAHEHVNDRRFCDACAAELQRRDPLMMYCRICLELDSKDRPHECAVHIIIGWDSGEVTRTRDGEWVTEVMAPDGVGWGGGT